MGEEAAWQLQGASWGSTLVRVECSAENPMVSEVSLGEATNHSISSRDAEKGDGLVQVYFRLLQYCKYCKISNEPNTIWPALVLQTIDDKPAFLNLMSGPCSY